MLLIFVTCSQVYLGSIITGNLPPPPPIFPPVTFPRYATHGIPKTQGNTSALVKIPKASHSNIHPATHGEDEDDISLEQDKLKQQLLEVIPGSSEAESLLETLEDRARKIIHPQTKTTASLLGIFAKALWKDRQGMFQGHFCDLI